MHPIQANKTRSQDRILFARFKSILMDSTISQTLKRRTDLFAQRMGRRPRILLCDIVSNHANRIDHLMPTAFSQWGFDVDIAPGDQPHLQTARTAVENDVHAVIFPFDYSQIGSSIAQLMDDVAMESNENILTVAWKQALEGFEDKFQTIGFDEILSISHDISPGLSRLLNRLEERKQTRLDMKQYIDGVVSGDKAVIAKAITLVESAQPEHQQAADRLIGELLPLSGNTLRIGISGVPGAGKSTFIESFGMILAKMGHRVAVLAVDPSSSKTGGSVLGDKTRMEHLASHPLAYIRPSASGGTLGGIAKKTREAMVVCEAAGFEILLVETVGVGQSESQVASMVDFFLVLMLTGAGDELQGIKKGILELADAIVINKADGDNVEKAREAKKIYESALSIVKQESPGWKVPVLTCSSQNMDGINDIWLTISDYQSKMEATGDFAQKRRRQAVNWMWALVEEGLIKRFYKRSEVNVLKLTSAVKEGRMSPTDAALELLDLDV
jgi:LAO/AO transport system kinase